MKVFLSSTAVDLVAYRQVADDTILRLSQQTLVMERFGPLPDEPVNACERKAQECDVLVCIVAYRYGFEPEAGKGSITRREVEAAHAAGRDVLVWIVADDHVWSERKEQDRLTDPTVLADPERIAAVARSVQQLQEFKTWLRRTFVCDTFTTPDDLGRKLAVTLSKYAREDNAGRLPATALARSESRIVHALHPAPHFHGREALLEDLSGWVSGLASPTCRVWALVGPGGCGKTAVAERLVAAKKPGEANLLVWSFYEQPDANAFLRECNHLFLGEEEGPAGERLEQLERGLRDGRPHLIVLDGLEQVQEDAGGKRLLGELFDHTLKRLLRALAIGLGQSRALVTSRFPLVDLEDWTNKGYRETPIDNLFPDAAVAVLRGWGVVGRGEALVEAAAQVGYHALSVEVIGSYLRSFAEGRIEEVEKFQLDIVKGHDIRAARLARILAYYSEQLPDDERDLLSELCRSTVEETFGHPLMQEKNIGAVTRTLLDKEMYYFYRNSLVKRGLIFPQAIGGCIRWRAHPFLSMAFGALQSGSPESIIAIGNSPIASLEKRPGRWLLRSKIDNAIVTKTNSSHPGGISIDQLLLEIADITPGEKVLIVSTTTGRRVQTFVATEERYSGIICMNGAAADMIRKGEEIIIMGFVLHVDGDRVKAKHISVELNLGRNMPKRSD
jgi:aspartate 1-decarboxylase